MKPPKNYMPSPLINILLIIFQIGVFLHASGLVLWLIAGIISIFTSGPTIHNDYPVMFSLADTGVLDIPGNKGNDIFEMGHATGVIYADFLPKSFDATYSLIFLIANFCILLSMWQIICILESVKKGRFFISENAIRLRWIALLALAIFFLERCTVIYCSWYFSDKLDYTGLEFSTINLYTFSNLQSVLGAFFLLVIAEAFRIGTQLKQENDLTI